ncbi:hypothetical protein E2C01_017004 [Portunus trituberculatus]|uniref:Uncharacterized protein n=1 Tax=Portunus trituberculatus TaxID=210409 RepID=A0A5B7DRS1_PORTR|nr:hypothetical protein [Portunus trituberculatus]
MEVYARTYAWHNLAPSCLVDTGILRSLGGTGTDHSGIFGGSGRRTYLKENQSTPYLPLGHSLRHFLPLSPAGQKHSPLIGSHRDDPAHLHCWRHPSPQRPSAQSAAECMIAKTFECDSLTLVALLSLATWRTGTLSAHVVTWLRWPTAALLAAAFPVLPQSTDCK